MELTQLGWNMVTLGFVGVVIFTFVEGWGVFKQNKEIWSKRSGASVSITYFTYFCFLFVSVFIYGIASNLIGMIFNGLLTLLYVPILVGLWKFKGFEKKDKWLLVGLVIASILMVLTPYKATFFLLMSFGSIIASAHQPYEIWKEKSAGVVSIKMLTAFCLSTIFWVIYAFAVKDVPLQIVVTGYMIVLSTTVAVWIRYRR